MGEDVEEDIMRVVDDKVGSVMLELVGDVVLLRKASMLVNLIRGESGCEDSLANLQC